MKTIQEKIDEISLEIREIEKTLPKELTHQHREKFNQIYRLQAEIGSLIYKAWKMELTIEFHGEILVKK